MKADKGYQHRIVISISCSAFFSSNIDTVSHRVAEDSRPDVSLQNFEIGLDEYCDSESAFLGDLDRNANITLTDGYGASHT